ncbi:MAG: DUF4112 domain-containing protein [Cyclobacteriaceae bacterium]
MKKDTDHTTFTSPELKWVNRISKLLDSQYKIPGTDIRFGWDPILSLFPVAGDFATYLVSFILIGTMYKHGASTKVVLKMVANSTLDFVIGSIPLVGTAFDLYFKSNERNLRLLKEYYEQRGSKAQMQTAMA